MQRLRASSASDSRIAPRRGGASSGTPTLALGLESVERRTLPEPVHLTITESVTAGYSILGSVLVMLDSGDVAPRRELFQSFDRDGVMLLDQQVTGGIRETQRQNPLLFQIRFMDSGI